MHENFNRLLIDTLGFSKPIRWVFLQFTNSPCCMQYTFVSSINLQPAAREALRFVFHMRLVALYTVNRVVAVVEVDLAAYD